MSKRDKNELRYWFTDEYSKFVELNQNKKKVNTIYKATKIYKILRIIHWIASYYIPRIILLVLF